MTLTDTTRIKRNVVPLQMSPLSKATLNYVDANPGCTLSELCSIYCPDAPSGKGAGAGRYRARLAYLVSVGHLVRAAVGGGYQIGDGVPLARPAPAAVAAEGAVPQRTPAAQYDRMHGPAYSHSLSQPTRPGALDYKACPSVGYRC